MTEQHKDFVFVHIPGTGGMWVRETVRQLGTVVRQPFHGKPTIEQVDGRMVFCFVRHPVLWLRCFWGKRTRSNWTIGGRDYWRDISHILQDCGDKEHRVDFDIFAKQVTEKHPGIIGSFFSWFMLPGMRVGRNERLTQDIKRFLPQLDLTRGATNVGSNLPEIKRSTWERVTKAEKELINQYYSDNLITYKNYKEYTMTEQKIDPEKIKEAAQALDIDVPILGARMVGNRIELHLYGGAVVTWAEPAKKAAPKKRTTTTKRATKKD
jgi:hypothetical protein